MTTISGSDFEFVRRVVWKSSAILLEEGKEYLAESRLNALASREGIGSIAELVNRLRGERGDDLTRKVVESMTTNETSFFRDVYPFEMLREQLLPQLIRLRASTRRLSIWSAACSSGQEIYSLAILLHEHFPELAGWSVRLLATDLSTEVVAKAKRGRFTQMEVNRGLSAALLLKYFRQDGSEWEIIPRLRAWIEFRTMNLIETWNDIESMDLIFLRNVLIYFDEESKRNVLSRVRTTLRPDGYLILGGTESALFHGDAFERITLGRAVAYRPAVPLPTGPGIL
ncbi:MAG: protein-glutamate O-methyltransferase CheR [Isosphaeraceae bacterium]